MARVSNFIRFTKFLAMWSLLFIFAATHKNSTTAQDKSIDSTDKKDIVSLKDGDDGTIISSAEDQDRDGFLFVDCTGFFE